MLAFCVGVLLLACVNVMNMQFARATLRAKELAIRSSLGATRVRLIRQMLTESLLVAVLGATLGVGLSYWAVDLLTSTVKNLANPIPAYITFDIDGRVLAFTVGATLVAALVSGLIPAWMSSRASASEALKDSGRGNTGRAINFITAASWCASFSSPASCSSARSCSCVPSSTSSRSTTGTTPRRSSAPAWA